MRIIIETDAPTLTAFLNATQIGLEGLEDPDTLDMVGMDQETADAARALLDSLCVQNLENMRAGL